MSMSYIRHSIPNQVDKVVANYVRWMGEREGCLSTFLFHGLFRDKSECRYDLLDVQQGVTARQFEFFVEYFLDKKYTFVTHEDILKGLSADKNYAYVTFDDGYFNNSHAVEILNKFKIPATFFISTDYVMSQKCFWWDVLMRERRKQNVNLKKITQEQEFLKAKSYQEIEDYIVNLFGAQALKPIGDVDRPLTVEELKHLSRQPFVKIGNHTSHHAILTNYSFQDAKEEISRAQEQLQKITGILPSAISYPNGNSSAETIAAAKEAGLKLGITGLEGKNYFPLNVKNGIVSLRRFILWGHNDFEGECLRARSDFQLKNILKRTKATVRELCSVSAR